MMEDFKMISSMDKENIFIRIAIKFMMVLIEI